MLFVGSSYEIKLNLLRYILPHPLLVVQFVEDNHCVGSLELSITAEYSKVGVPRLPPGILQGIVDDVRLGSNDPICDIAASGGGDLLVGVLIEEPSVILGPQLGLECLVVPNVDRLEETGASGWNELHLDAKILDPVDDGG